MSVFNGAGVVLLQLLASSGPPDGGVGCKPSGMFGIDWLAAWRGCLVAPSSEVPLEVFVGMCVWCLTWEGTVIEAVLVWCFVWVCVLS